MLKVNGSANLKTLQLIARKMYIIFFLIKLLLHSSISFSISILLLVFAFLLYITWYGSTWVIWVFVWVNMAKPYLNIIIFFLTTYYEFVSNSTESVHQILWKQPLTPIYLFSIQLNRDSWRRNNYKGTEFKKYLLQEKKSK